MATAAIKAKREPPEGGGIVWHEEWHAFECQGCGEFVEIRSAAKRTADKLAETKQLLVIDHMECWKYEDPKMAADARKHRKAGTLRKNLAAQSVAWRGGRFASDADRDAAAIRERWRR